jgi:hypothetical protein
MNIPESDWKKFKPLRDKALERYCEIALSEIEAASADDTFSNHEKYLKIYSLIIDRDKELGLIFDGYSRSKALIQLAMIQSRNLLELKDFECFSESTQKYLAGFRN